MRAVATVALQRLRKVRVRMSSPTEAPTNNQTANQLIVRFFEAYNQNDWQSIARCYHDKASFSDPIYPDLREESIVYLWFDRLATRKKVDLKFRVVFADERKVQVEWSGLSPLHGRSVRINGLSTFALWDEAIVRHVDEYSFVDWSRQALGWKAWLMGGLRFYQTRVQRSARSQLDQVAGTMG
jgi:hypothetical protein